jgi:protein disulfide-isomerase A1
MYSGHCKELAPEYSKAALELAAHDPPYYLAKVDATENQQLADKYDVQSYPTLIFFKRGAHIPFTGGRTAKEIVEWYIKKSGPASVEVSSCEDLKKKIEIPKIAVAFFGDISTKQFKEDFMTVATNEAVSEKIPFFHTSDVECGKSLGLKSFPSIALFRKFEDSPLFYEPPMEEGWTPALMLGWIQAASVPFIFEFSEDYIEPIFTQRRKAIILFRDNQEAKTAKYQKVFEEAAKLMKNEMLFVYSDVEEGMQARLADYLSIENNNLPALRILDPANKDLKKYIYYGDLESLSVEDIRSFISDFNAGKLKPFFKSDRPPKDTTKPLKLVVGSTHKDIVMDSANDVFIKYYAPWCGHCQLVAPIWEELAVALKDVQGLTIADMDATSNEVEALDFEGFPTLKLYLQGKKGEPIEYDGERSVEDFKIFLAQHSTAYANYLKEKGPKPITTNASNTQGTVEEL